MGQLDGKVAVITGASRGLGFVTAQTFYNEGASVVMVSRNVRNIAKAAVAIDPECQYHTDRVLAIRCNVTFGFSVQSMVKQVISHYGRIDILICNAGTYGPIGLLENCDINEWSNAVQTNLMGTMLCCRSVIPIMREQKYGKIIALSGGGATSANPRFSAYAASKAAIVRLVETLAAETEGSGIDINAMAPGAMNTTMLEEALIAGPEKVGDEAYAKLLDQQESGGVNPADSAELILHLCSDSTNGVSGNLFSAVWDDWQSIDSTTWKQGDKYKLRRIV